MKTKLFILIAALIFSTTTLLAQSGGKAEPKRIQLPKGKTSVSLTGNLKEGEIAEYVFKASKKKLVFLWLSSVKPKGRFHSFFVKGDAIDFQSEQERLEVEKFQAPETGDYFIFVQFKPSGKVRQGTYKLTLEFKD